MKVILTENVPNIGRKGEIKEVKPGLAMHHLLPKNLAVEATPNRIAVQEQKQARMEHEVKEQAVAHQKNARKLANTSLTIEQDQVTATGKLFGSLGQQNIAQALKEKLGVSVEPASLETDRPVKELGSYRLTVHFGEQKVSIPLEIKKGE